MERHDGYNVFTIKYGAIPQEIRSPVEILDNKGNVIKKATGLWDSGASSSCISNECAQMLGLKQIAFTTIHTANGTATAPVYYANFRFNDKVKFLGTNLIGAKLTGIDMLIGMDVITKGNLSISTHDGKTIFSFIVPAHKSIDYGDVVHDINKAFYKKLGRNAPCPCGSGKKVKDCCGKLYF